MSTIWYLSTKVLVDHSAHAWWWNLCEPFKLAEVFEKVFPVRCAMVMFQNISSSGFLSSCRYGFADMWFKAFRSSDISQLNWSLHSALLLLPSSTTTNNVFQKSSPWQWMFNSLVILIILGTVRMCVWRCSKKITQFSHLQYMEHNNSFL